VICVVAVSLVLLTGAGGKPTALKAHPTVGPGCPADTRVVFRAGPRLKRSIDVCPIPRRP
jgi:hypothetical protein